MDNDIDKYVEEIISSNKNININETINITEIDKYVDIILQSNNKTKTNSLFDKVQIKTVEHKDKAKTNSCILQ
jgi:hypothetical protein